MAPRNLQRGLSAEQKRRFTLAKAWISSALSTVILLVRNKANNVQKSLCNSLTLVFHWLQRVGTSFRPIALESPFHGPSFLASTQANFQRCLCAFLLLFFVAMTVKEAIDTLDVYRSEAGYFETSLKPMQPLQVQSFILGFPRSGIFKFVRKSNIVDYTRNVDLSKWNSSDESVFPDTVEGDDKVTTLVFATWLTMTTVYSAESRLQYLLANPFPSENVEKAWLDDILPGHNPSDTTADVRILKGTYDFWRKSRVSFGPLIRTAAVLVCRLTRPELQTAESQMGNDEICTKRAVTYETISDDNGPLNTDQNALLSFVVQSHEAAERKAKWPKKRFLVASV
ncbi:unnamed protein product [Sphagnum jensenii]